MAVRNNACKKEMAILRPESDMMGVIRGAGFVEWK